MPIHFSSGLFKIFSLWRQNDCNYWRRSWYWPRPRFAVTEVGGNVAILDALDTPHEHYYKLEKNPNVKVKLYKPVPGVLGGLSDMSCALTAPASL
jgi:hypothetical protein